MPLPLWDPPLLWGTMTPIAPGLADICHFLSYRRVQRCTNTTDNSDIFMVTVNFNNSVCPDVGAT